MTFTVVLGAGSTGMATTRLLADSGERVRQLTRSGSGLEHPLVELVAVDATDADSLTSLAEGAVALINCAAPPYDRWPEEFPALAAAQLTAAERTGVGYVMLGNVYGYGPVHGSFTEELPMSPTTVKGAVRARIWENALASSARVTEVRAADFLGAGVYSLFNLMATTPLLAGDPAFLPYDLDVPQSWSYTGDVARTLVAAARAERSWGKAWHVPSTVISARDLATRLILLTGAPEPKLESLPLEEIHRLARTDSIMAEVPEMQYLYRRPFVLDSTLTQGAFGFGATPLDDALIEMAGR
ncbi:NAD-dependent epimerase/dehydratase family protein [Streptosporangium sp. NBC_01639]|uniref:NAD-dependent epimerase/dehydratase family protein n=1 Tax=Streptosporangium sp. NBC_01639 TaxID=2975948 RepID=UPI0038675D15|nr:NAD-dependent epimerase/dehydratase family protein [Streptosporangium sp. NBC_01639]